jgi:hypothetical protein
MIMADPKTPAAKPKVHGPDVVDALQNAIVAQLTDITVQEAHAALAASWTAEGRGLTPTDEMKLRLLSSLGRQLVTATTPVGGAS